jgi:hypothetical protein
MGAVFQLPPIQLNAHQNAAFTNSVQALVTNLENDSNRVHAVAQFCRKFQVKRRRLYDVINVLTAIGCASRNGANGIVWHGMEKTRDHLKRASAELEIHNLDRPLCELFPSDHCVGLPSLTVSFILLFSAMQIDNLDLREVSCFFSRNTVRYKSTLCKLYQIALILSAIGLIARTTKVCEVKIQPPFSDELREVSGTFPTSIESLLSRPPKEGDRISRRRAEYQKFSRIHGHGAD